jgi:hypothetical protein
MYRSSAEDKCVIDGKVVLDQYGYGTGEAGRYVVYMLLIVLVYRLLGWFVLWVRKH